MSLTDVEDQDYLALIQETRKYSRNAPDLDTPSVAEEALDIIDGPRKDTYGDPEDALARIAVVWGVLLGCELTSTQVALMNVAEKLIRETGPGITIGTTL